MKIEQITAAHYSPLVVKTSAKMGEEQRNKEQDE